MHRVLPAAVMVLGGLAACERHSPETTAAAPVAAPQMADAKAADTDKTAWLGRWVGPEGTLLDLARKGDGYEIRIQSLDGSDSYQGRSVGDHLEFQRRGATEVIRAGTGADTGMKWLADKQNCLVIRSGEGFCRD